MFVEEPSSPPSSLPPPPKPSVRAAGVLDPEGRPVISGEDLVVDVVEVVVEVVVPLSGLECEVEVEVEVGGHFFFLLLSVLG